MSMIIKSAHIYKFRALNNVDFNLGSKLTAIVGQNGTMKTTVLGILSQTFTISKNHPMYGETTIDGYNFKSTFVYIDPPYYKEGANLYRCYYTHAQHAALAKFILTKSYPWLISYDDSDNIKKMYNSLSPLEIYMDYSVHTSRREVELLISNLEIPPLEADTIEAQNNAS